MTAAPSPPATGQDDKPEPVTCAYISKGKISPTLPMETIGNVGRSTVQILKDTGAEKNLVSEDVIRKSGLKTTTLPKPIPLSGVDGPTGLSVTQTVRMPLKLQNGHLSEEVFLVCPLGTSQHVILGRPWLYKFCKEAMKALEEVGNKPQPLPPSTNPNTAFSAGGVIAAIEAEEARRHQALQRTITCLAISANIADALKEKEDPGVRGLTGNKENWIETIPESFRSYADSVFSDESASKLPPLRPGLDCEIKIREGEKLKTSKIYDMSQQQLTNLKALLDVELQKGFIRPSQSPSSAPVFFVTDPPSESRNKGQERLVVDYRDLNTKIELDEYPIPLSRTVMARLPKAKIFTKFDVRSGFSNLRMAPGSEKHTAFKTFFGLYEYQVMPMGLATAPSVFQRFINHVLAPFLDVFCFAYLDDIIIFSDSEKEHEEHVRKILEALKAHDLHLKPGKCVWKTNQVSFLGFTAVAGKGIRMSDDKVRKIQNLESPRDVSEVRAVLGLINFYNAFIPHYSDLCAPLNELTEKDRPWSWEERHEQAFREILRRVNTDVFLAAFDPDLPIVLETDASDVAYAGVIMQAGPDGRLRPVVMFHHKFHGHEKGWDIHDKELFAIVFAFRTYRHFLSQPRFPVKVYTDHRNLAKFMFTTDLLKSHDGRLARWWETLSQSNFTIEYRPGQENTTADFLSRYRQDLPEPKGLLLLPEKRFSPKALTDCITFLKKKASDPNIRSLIEQKFGAKQIGSPLPVEDGTTPRRLLKGYTQVSTQQAQYARTVWNQPETRRPGDRRGLGYPSHGSEEHRK